MQEQVERLDEVFEAIANYLQNYNEVGSTGLIDVHRATIFSTIAAANRHVVKAADLLRTAANAETFGSMPYKGVE